MLIRRVFARKNLAEKTYQFRKARI